LDKRNAGRKVAQGADACTGKLDTKFAVSEVFTRIHALTHTDDSFGCLLGLSRLVLCMAFKFPRCTFPNSTRWDAEAGGGGWN
jgi:hypothetical protein